MSSVSSTEQTARRASRSPAFRIAARSGYAIAGLLHVLIGVIAITLADGGGGGGQASEAGALSSLSQAPGGFLLIIVCAIGLAALGLWLAVDAFLEDSADDSEKWKNRIKGIGKAIAYLALAGIAVSVLMGASSGGGGQQMSAAVMAVPGGAFLVGAVGLGIVAGGGYFIVKGVTRRFRRDLAMPGDPMRRVVLIAGTTGYVAKGIALAVTGVLVVIAAVTSNPQQAGGLDTGLRALIELPFGQALLIAVGVGLVLYGGYLGLRARYAKL